MSTASSQIVCIYSALSQDFDPPPSDLSLLSLSPILLSPSKTSLCSLIRCANSLISSSCSSILLSISGTSLACALAFCRLCLRLSVAVGMSLIVSGPVPNAIWEGEAAAGEPTEVAEVWETFCRRERIEARIGTVSIESGHRPSGKERPVMGG